MNKQKIKILSYMIVLLWVAAFTQMMVNRFFMKEDHIIEAFSNTDTNIVESRLELTADYGHKKLSNEGKRKLLKVIAETIGLTKYEISQTKDNNMKVLKGERVGKNAITTIEIITKNIDESNEFRNYILVSIDIYKNTDSIVNYKSMLETVMKDIKVEKQQTILRFNGVSKGALSEEEKEREVLKMLHNLQAKVIDQYSDKGVLTVYAYTGLIKEYLVVNRRRINVNVAVNYDEKKDQTNIYLATPILNEDY